MEAMLVSPSAVAQRNRAEVITLVQPSYSMFVIPLESMKIKNGDKEITHFNASVGKSLDCYISDKELAASLFSIGKIQFKEVVKGYELSSIRLKDPSGRELNVYINYFKIQNKDIAIAAISKNSDKQTTLTKILDAYTYTKEKLSKYCNKETNLSKREIEDIEDNLKSAIERDNTKFVESNKKNETTKLVDSTGLYITHHSGVCFTDYKGKNIKPDLDEKDQLVAPHLNATCEFIISAFKDCELDSLELKNESQNINLYFRRLRVNRVDKTNNINLIAMFKGNTENLNLGKKAGDIRFLLVDKYSRYLYSNEATPLNVSADFKEKLINILN